jgi:P4 family phage/plasmid primase-like protien
MKQLELLKFCRIKRGEKRPFEKEWQKKPYSYEEIKKYIPQENYGVLCGYEGLIIIDADTPELTEEVLDKLPNTFRVQTGSGGVHHYFFCPELKEKIVLTNNKHYGEVQNWGSQCVGPNCLHPNGKTYQIIEDSKIAKISREELINCISKFKKEKIVLTSEKKEDEEEWIEKFIEEVSAKWIKGDRQNLALSTAGYLRKEKGLGFNNTKNIILRICEKTKDQEKSSRVRAVAETFKKDEKQVRGSMGMKERGIENKLFSYFSKETNYLKIVEEFYFHQPFYYDSFRIWWIWEHENYKWKRIDETDLMNAIDKLTSLPNVSTQIKSNLLEAFKRIGRKKKPINPKSTWIQFVDKIIDVETGEEIPASPKYFIFNSIPFSLSDSEETPIMDKIFEEWVGKDYVKTLYEILAYSILPDMPIHRIFCFIGSGMNGKSKFLELLRKFVGHDNCCSTELDVLLQSRFEITRLHKKLVCQMGETNFNEMSKTSILKKLSGGDLIGFEYKNKDPFEEKNYAKILIATNNLPTTTDKTIGFYRRWIIVDFPNQFSEKKDILAEIPEEEYKNLAKKTINILFELLNKRTFHKEGTIDERKERYEAKSNFLETFLNLFTEEDINGYITKSDFFKKFSEWSKENRHREMSEKSLSLAMKKIGIESEKKHFSWMYDGKGGQARIWRGIKWKE